MIADSVVVSGASSGIGRAFAVRCAGAGVTLGLIGRNPERLEAVATTCRAKGARVRTIAIDVRERERLGEWLLAQDAEAPVQLVVANAGVALAAAGDPADPAVFDEISINLMGSLHTALRCFRACGREAVGRSP
jgi:short-subunit dehydrogenase